MVSTTSAGTKVAISAGVPTTNDAAGFAALTYTVIKGVESLPAVGAQVAVNSFQPLDGPVEKHKGPVNYGSLALPYAHDGADAGQILLRTAAGPTNNAQYCLKITYSNGDISYVRGRAFGDQLTAGAATNVLMGNTTFEVNQAPINVAAT